MGTGRTDEFHPAGAQYQNVWMITAFGEWCIAKRP